MALASARDGKLIAAGVMSIISAVVAGGFGLLALAVAIAVDGVDDDALWGTGDAWSFLFGAVSFFLFAAAVLAMVAGVGCVRGRRWGKIMTLIIWGLALGLMLAGFADQPSVEAVVPMVWAGVIVALTTTSTPWD